MSNINFENISSGAILKFINENKANPDFNIALKSIDAILKGGEMFGLTDEQIINTLKSNVFTPAGIDMPDIETFAKIKRNTKEVPEIGKSYRLILCGEPTTAECVYISEWAGEKQYVFKAENGRLSVLLFRSINYTSK